MNVEENRENSQENEWAQLLSKGIGASNFTHSGPCQIHIDVKTNEIWYSYVTNLWMSEHATSELRKSPQRDKLGGTMPFIDLEESPFHKINKRKWFMGSFSYVFHRT